MQTQRITELLEVRLGVWAESQELLVAYDNVEFNPPSGSIYLRSKVIPARTTSIDLAEQTRIYAGVYQVSIVTPANTGKKAGSAVVQSIIELFDLGTRLSDNYINVDIATIPVQFPPVQTNAHYTIPVSMNYRADII